MSTPATIALVLLTYDELDGVRSILPQLPDPAELGVDEIFAVDGGSTDGTLEVLATHQVPVHLQQSRGRGNAMRLAAAKTSCSHLVFFSPDGNEDWRDIPAFRAYFEQGFDLVIASRMMQGAHNEEDDLLFRPRKWVNNGFNLAGNLLFRRQGPYITDSINGFRGMRRDLLTELDVRAAGFTVEYQMTLRAMSHRMKIVEFPTFEGPRIGGETKAPSLKTGLQFIYSLWYEIWRREKSPPYPE